MGGQPKVGQINYSNSNSSAVPLVCDINCTKYPCCPINALKDHECSLMV